MKGTDRPAKRWMLREADPDALSALLAVGVPPVAAKVLAARGFSEPRQIQEFLAPELSLRSPFELAGMRSAVTRIKSALSRREKMRVYGDYDVDGVTSVALLLSYLKARGADVDYYIPNRFDEGYGVSKEAIDIAAADGVRLLVTVDCGITAVEEVDHATSLGVDVVITDHHHCADELPRAVAVVDPQQPGSSDYGRELAGVGVAFKLVQALATEAGAVSREGDGPRRVLSGLDEYVDLVALGTIADVVPLLGENRLYVKLGLTRIGQSPRPGLAGLIEAGGLGSRKVDGSLVAFGLAPRLNAAGRVGDPRLAVELLLAPDRANASPLAAQLDAANRTRQELEEETLQQALQLLPEQVDLAREKVIVVAGNGWHQGVIGIVASRVTEMFARPSVLISLKDGVGHGSCRSVQGLDIHAALCASQESLIKCGGHAMAAGLTVASERVGELRERLNAYADSVIDWEDLRPTLAIDAGVAFSEIKEEVVQELSLLAPFGAGNPAPVLGLEGVQVVECRGVGTNRAHLKLTVGSPGERHQVDCIGFGLGRLLDELNQHFGPVNIAFSPEMNEWNGCRSVQLVLADVQTQAVSTSPVDALFAAAEEETVDPYADILKADEFFSKVVGVTFENRQSDVARLSTGEQLRLVREPENSHDPNAVRVETGAGAHLGYLKADLARHLAVAIDGGNVYEAHVASVTGGTATGGEEKSLGVNIFIQREPSEDDALARAEMVQTRDGLVTGTDEEVWNAIRGALLGGAEFRPKQQAALAALQSGHNTLAIMGTGRGKSAIFQAYGAYLALRQAKSTIIVYPLRALVNDQLEAARRRLTPLGVRVHKATGSLTTREREELSVAVALGEVDVVLATPEFIASNLAAYPELVSRVGLFVVDECHHASQLNSNRTTYRRLDSLRERLGNPLTLAVTATADDEVASEIITQLQIDEVIVDPHVRTNLRVDDRRGTPERDKLRVLEDFVRRGEKTVVYVNSRDGAVDLARRLRQRNLELKDSIAFYHGGLTNSQRVMLETLFRDGALKLIVSTSAFGEGIDIPDIRHVVHYHLTFNGTDFNQQSGRAGRDGGAATVHLLYNERDIELNRYILSAKAPDREALKQIYLALTEVAAAGEAVALTNQGLADLANARAETGNAAFRTLTDDGVSAALGIFAELGLVEREKDGRSRLVRLVGRPEKKLDLTTSVRYNEGMQEKEAFEAFKVMACRAPVDQLLALINQPIYPRTPPTAA